MKILFNLEKIWVKACYDEDMVAESICGGQGMQEGHIFAVRRPCPGSETCEAICESNELKAQDSQAKAQTNQSTNCLQLRLNSKFNHYLHF